MHLLFKETAFNYFPVFLPKERTEKKTSSQERGQKLLYRYKYVLKHRFEDLLPLLSALEDSRGRKDYSMEEIVMGAIAIFLFKQGSRNSLNNKRREDPFVENYEQTFGVRLPHQDTSADVLRELAPEKLEQVKMDLMNHMFEQKWLRDYQLEHKYCRNSYKGLQNYYTCLQIAHAVNQFLERSSEVMERLKEHSKETITNIWQNLIAYMIMVNP